MNTPSRWSLLAASALAFLVPRAASVEEEATPTCSEDWKEKVYVASRDSVVSIETKGFAIEHIDPVAGIVYPDIFLGFEF